MRSNRELLERLRISGPNAPLIWTAWINLGLLLTGLAAAPFDHRLVLGINPWIKPAKFEISIILYVLTLAVLLPDLAGAERLKRFVRWGAALSMTAEIAIIAGQAARGTRSHFNNTSTLDITLFSIMGSMIVLNSVLLAFLLLAFFRSHLSLRPAYLWGIRFGLVSILLASAEGALMIGHAGHTVGAADGGPGLPFVNWSTRYGDLRISHFLGMHGLQLFPLAGWFFSRTNLSSSSQLAAVASLFLVYVAIAFWTFAQAICGHPLISFLP